jgi:hypothetical protein
MAWKTYPVSVYVLPPLYAVVLVALWWNRRTEPRPDILSTLRGKVVLPQYALLLIIPVVASVTYAVYCSFDLYVPITMYVVLPLMFGGFGVLALSFIMIAFRRKSRTSENISTNFKPADTI